VKKYFLFTSILLFFILFISCEKVNKTGDLTWTLKNGTLTISGQGAMPNYADAYNTNDAPWGKNDRLNITNIIINEGITNIGDNAFINLINVVAVSLPDTLTNIGKNSFKNCSGLTLISIPNGVINIGDSAFQGCNNLIQVILSSSPLNIDKSAFEDCGKLIQKKTRRYAMV